ncbi:MAG: FeoA domain-containing protein [Candidatus Zixiibacteriota bacterium]
MFKSLFASGHGSPIARNSDISLSDTIVGHTYILVALEAGQHLREKIASMGLNSGARFTIIANSGHGPVGLEVRQTRLGIGRGMALKIKVKEVESA